MDNLCDRDLKQFLDKIPGRVNDFRCHFEADDDLIKMFYDDRFFLEDKRFSILEEILMSGFNLKHKMQTVGRNEAIFLLTKCVRAFVGVTMMSHCIRDKDVIWKFIKALYKKMLLLLVTLDVQGHNDINKQNWVFRHI